MTDSLRTLTMAACATVLHASGSAYATDHTPTPVWDETVEWGEEGPLAREHPSLMVFGDQIVILGGSGYEPQGVPLGDGWVFDTEEQSWRALNLEGEVPAPAGSRRVAQALGADHAWIFGGYGANFETNNDLFRVTMDGDALTFDRIEQIEAPDARAFHALAFDPVSDALIVTHGVSQAGFFDDTHIGRLDNDGRMQWERFESETHPGPRFGFAYGYDSTHGELVLFSGQTPGREGDAMPMSDETWVFRALGPDAGWARVETATPPPGRRNPMFAFDDASDRLVVWCGTADARSNIPGVVLIDRDQNGAWGGSVHSDEGAPPRRSSGVGFVEPGGGRVFLGFGNSRAGQYRDWVALNPSALVAPVEEAESETRTEPANEEVSAEAVEHAIREYVFAKYAGDEKTVRSRAHHDIARRAVSATYWGQPSDEWVRPYNHDVLQFYGSRANQTRLQAPESGRCDITVYDVETRSAAAVVIMEDVADFLHLVRFDGRWLIADSAVLILDEPGADPPQPSDDDEHIVREIVRDYCMGFYEIDGDKVQQTCHPILSKRTVEHWGEAPAFDYFRSITWEEIRILGNTFNRSFGFNPATARCEIDVYEITGNVALAKLTASVWFDYFQLMKVNGEWTIVSIMFEGLSEERSEQP